MTEGTDKAAALTARERRLVRLLSGDIGDGAAPYAELGEKCGLSEGEVLAAIGRFQAAGLIRRLGATLWHQRSGFRANAMVVWRVAAGRAEAAGQALSALPYVSHCYLRRPLPGWPYNLYAMVHGADDAALDAMVAEMAALIGCDDWRKLESVRELKKSSLAYFSEEESAR